jgi:hypothetical protein
MGHCGRYRTRADFCCRAVALTLWRGAADVKYQRRLHVFRTLMATRRIPISPDHVNALNLIEVDFYKCKKVEEELIKYLAHLRTDPDDLPWHEKKRCY